MKNKINKEAESLLERGSVSKPFQGDDNGKGFDVFVTPNNKLVNIKQLLEFYRDKITPKPDGKSDIVEFFDTESMNYILKYIVKNKIVTIKLPIKQHIKCLIDNE